jgi:hypothetical protein
MKKILYITCILIVLLALYAAFVYEGYAAPDKTVNKCNTSNFTTYYKSRVNDNNISDAIISKNPQTVSDSVIVDYKKAWSVYNDTYNTLQACSTGCVGGTINAVNDTCVCPPSAPIPYVQDGKIYCVNNGCNSNPNVSTKSDIADLIKGVCTCAVGWLGSACLTKYKNYARYVRIQRIHTSGSSLGDYINLGELRVFDNNGVNVAKGKIPTSSSLYAQQFAGANLTDDNPSSFFHSNAGVGEWVMVDLGEPVLISQIDVVNRQDCCQERAVGLQVQLYLADPTKNVPVQMINFGKTVKSIYQWTLTTTAATPKT